MGNFPLVKLHIERSSDYIGAHCGFDDFLRTHAYDEDRRLESGQNGSFFLQ